MLIVNEVMAIACRVIEDADGFFTLSALDQLTGQEIPSYDGSLPDLETAVEKARRVVILDSPKPTAELHSIPAPTSRLHSR